MSFNLKSRFKSLRRTHEVPTKGPSDVSEKKNILAFRTITTLLSKIQQQSSISNDNLRPQSEAEHQELSVLNALATVIVMNNSSVIATVASHHPEHGDLGILACQQPELKSEASKSTSSNLFQFFISKNPRKDCTVSNTVLVLGDPKNPNVTWDDSDPAAQQKLLEYVNQRWWVLCFNISTIHDIICNRSGETLESHIWNLMKLLVLPDPAEELLAYVVATCFPKIHFRLNRKSVSMPYFTSLTQVAVETIKFEEPSLHESINESQQKNDKILLQSLCRLQLFVDLPKLTELAAKDKLHTLYTKDTYQEFHLLLIGLLKSFRDALGKLTSLHGGKAKREAGSNEFREELRKSLMYGYALQRVIQGSGISPHLKNLVPLLGDHRREERAILTMTDEELDERLDDVDLLQIQPGVIGRNGRPQSVWKSYFDWLRLILAHFHAVEILVQFVKSPYFHTTSKGISIKILTSPNVGVQKLPWEEVMKNSKFFPVGPEMNNDDIIKSLSSGITSHSEAALNKIKSFGNYFQRFQESLSSTSPLNHRDLLSSTKELESLKNQTRWADYIEQIYSNVLQLQKSSDNSQFMSKINEAIQMLLEDAKLFRLFRNVNSMPFGGSVHCEATFASLFLLPSSPNNDLSSQLKVIYIDFILFTVLIYSTSSTQDESLEFQNGVVRRATL
jgi:hypothetical protein